MFDLSELFRSRSRSNSIRSGTGSRKASSASTGILSADESPVPVSVSEEASGTPVPHEEVPASVEVSATPRDAGGTATPPKVTVSNPGSRRNSSVSSTRTSSPSPESAAQGIHKMSSSLKDEFLRNGPLGMFLVVPAVKQPSVGFTL